MKMHNEVKTEKNFQCEEAVNKLQELINDIRVCIFLTTGKSGGSISRPMTVVHADDKGGIWFYARQDSHAVKDIAMETYVELVFAHPGKDTYLHVHGRPSVVTDSVALEEKWDPVVYAWVPNGLKDPDLCLIRVKTDEAHYWCAASIKMRSIFQAFLSAFTGKQVPQLTHGSLVL